MAQEGGKTSHTIASLRLDLDAARDGKTWLLLPDGFRDQAAGHDYPLPTRRVELQRIVLIPFPPNKTDSGCIYLRRAMTEFRKRESKRQSATLDVSHRQHRVEDAARSFSERLKELRVRAIDAVESVKRDAEKAAASLHDLFALGRRGIEGQMKAHLDGQPWMNEPISARDFRDCFRLVSQTVRGMGLPSDQQGRARDAVMEQVAESLKATRATVALAADPSDNDKEPN